MMATILAALGLVRGPVADPVVGAWNVSIKDVPADVPGFKRIYTVRLDDRATLKITTHRFLSTLMVDGELDQPDRKWVLFDPDNIAEKILDPTLVPKVRSAVDAVMSIDRAWRASKPSQFTDERGDIWVRRP